MTSIKPAIRQHRKTQLKQGRSRHSTFPQLPKTAEPLAKSRHEETTSKQAAVADLKTPAPGLDHSKTQQPRNSRRDNLFSMVLKLNPKQIQRLHNLFLAPKAIARLLASSSEAISTRGEALLFLLKNRKDLEQYLVFQDRSEMVTLLTALVLEWDGESPDMIRLRLDDAHLSTRSSLSIAIDGFGRLGFENPEVVQRYLSRLQCIPPFYLRETNGVVYVECETAKKTPTQDKTTAIRGQNRSKNSKNSSSSGRAWKGGKPESKKSKSTKKHGISFSAASQVAGLRMTNWSSLSGWQVSGGLPGLGRRSR